MILSDRRTDAHFQFCGDGAAEIQTQCIDIGVDRLGHNRPGQPPVMQGPCGENRNASGNRRKRPGGGITSRVHCDELATCGSGNDFGDEVILGRKIAVNRAGGDVGALCDSGDLHRAHALFADDRLRCAEDRLLTLCEPAGHILGAAVRHARLNADSRLLGKRSAWLCLSFFRHRPATSPVSLSGSRSA